jgi:DNA modification methylase
MTCTCKKCGKPFDAPVQSRHRLLCGDSTKGADLATLMEGQKATMLFTDPPWNVAIGGDANPRHRQRPGLQNDDLSPAEYQAFLESWITRVPAVVTGDVYCILGASEWPRLDAVLRGCGFHWSATVIWVKDLFVLGRSKYHRRYEPLWYGWHTKGESSFCDRRDLDDVWEIARPRVSDDHPTMKPVELVARAVTNSSRTGQVVLDLFGGSGSTLVAAEQTSRRAFLMEIDPLYCDVIVQRWEKFTGKKAERIAANTSGERTPAEQAGVAKTYGD